MILGDYVAKVAAQETFGAQLEVAIFELNHQTGARGGRFSLYVLTPRELERLRSGIDIQSAFLEFEDGLEAYCTVVFGRRRVIYD